MYITFPDEDKIVHAKLLLAGKKMTPKIRYAQFRSRWGAVFTVKGLKRNANMVKWCIENCSGEYSHSVGYEVFYFQLESDACKFTLKWK